MMKHRHLEQARAGLEYEGLHQLAIQNGVIAFACNVPGCTCRLVVLGGKRLRAAAVGGSGLLLCHGGRHACKQAH
jgi:hypothetical protein